MKSRRIPMIVDEFHRLEWEQGWKYEYLDGCAYISPREIGMSCSVPTGPRDAPPAAISPQPVVATDAGALIDAHVAAFGDGVEYCDWPAEKIREDAMSNIDGFFAGRRGAPLAASRIVRGGGKDRPPLVGALLIVEIGDGLALLDLLFVVPEGQRRGLASAMAASALPALHQMGFHALESRYLLGNQASRAWHHRLGFADRPDALSARAILAHARHRLEREELLGNADPDVMSRRAQEVVHWEMAVKRLDAEAARRWEARHSATTRRG